MKSVIVFIAYYNNNHKYIILYTLYTSVVIIQCIRFGRTLLLIIRTFCTELVFKTLNDSMVLPPFSIEEGPRTPAYIIKRFCIIITVLVYIITPSTPDFGMLVFLNCSSSMPRTEGAAIRLSRSSSCKWMATPDYPNNQIPLALCTNYLNSKQ